MKSFLSYLFILIGLGAMILSTSQKTMQVISDKRRALSGPFGMHSIAGGDLVSLAYLDREKKFFEPKDYVFHRPADTVKGNIDLYVWGDSYLMKDHDSSLALPDSAFARISHYHFGRRDHFDLRYTLDPFKRNILVIEISERFLRSYFADLSIYNHVKKAELPSPVSSIAAPVNTAGMIPDIEWEYIFNPKINQNLEFNLFNYNFLTPARTLKAAINYRLFDRASGLASVSDDRNYLFLKMTTHFSTLYHLFDMYDPISKAERDSLHTVVDSVYRHYKREGFDEVYFSIIPNPATILQPVSPEGLRYNGLIDDIQSYAAQKSIPFIDVYSLFLHYPDKASLFRTGDTHWKNNGLQLWLSLFNAELKRQSMR